MIQRTLFEGTPSEVTITITPLDRNEWGNCSAQSNHNRRDGGNRCERPARFNIESSTDAGYPGLYCTLHRNRLYGDIR